MRIGIIGNYGVGNLGDEAILLGFRRLIADKYGNDAEIHVFGRGKLLPLGVRSFLKSLVHPQLWKPLGELKKCDKVILGGGGLFSDEEKAFTALFWALQGLFCIWYLKKPVACIGVSLGRMGWISKHFVKRFFRGCTGVIVRDDYSEKTVKSWGVKCDLSSDIAFALESTRSSNLHIYNKNVVISLREYPGIGGNLYKTFAQTLDYVIEDLGYNITFIAFVEGARNDTLFMNKILVHMKSPEGVKFLPFGQNVSSVLNVISGAKYVISSRFHAGVFSCICAVPYLPISYSSKVASFWKGYSLNGLDYSNLSFEDIKFYLSRLENNYGGIQEEVAQILEAKNALLTKTKKYI